MTIAIQSTAPTKAASARRSIVTISTTAPSAVQNVASRSWISRIDSASGSLTGGAFGVVAWVLAAVVGIVLGIAIGLVSAGFDTTRLLLAVGAVALGLGWLIALVTSPAVVGRSRR